ncbi:MAG: hypothetical protein H0W12_05360 [Chitinophagaceae bacterium]|nr:hypothetical protein [Chitinophagaceae bacterium]
MKLIAPLIFFCLILSACKKDNKLSAEEIRVIEVNKAKLYARWHFVSLVTSGEVETNATPSYADDFLEFRTDGRGTISEGALSDNPNIFTPQDFDWKFRDTANIDFGADEITLQKLNDTALWFTTIRNKTGSAHDEWRWKR